MLNRIRTPLSIALVTLLCALLLVEVSGSAVRAAPPGQVVPYRIGYISNETSILVAAYPGADKGYRALPRTVLSSVDAEASAGGDPARGTAGLVWVSKRSNAPGGVQQPGDLWYLADGAATARRLTDDDGVDSHPALSPDGEWVAFDSVRNGNTDVWVLKVDGSEVRRVTSNPAEDSWPAWSPDGRSLVFSSTRDDPDGDIYTLPLGTGQPRRITNNPAADTQPAWSPRGDRIAFRTTRFRAAGDVVLLGVDGGEVRRVVPDFDSAEPAWSADGTHLAFSTRRDDRYGDVYEVDVASGAITAVSANPWVGDTHPTWRRTVNRPAPDAATARSCCRPPPGPGTVVFTRLHRGQTSDVWSADSSGADRRDHTIRPDASETDPAYSADGTRLAYTEFSVQRGVGSRVMVADAEGRDPRPLTPELPEGVAQREPAWSPDGTMIAYAEASWTESGQECVIRIVRVADGVLLATIPMPESYVGADGAPAWSPDGTRIAFVRNVYRVEPGLPRLLASSRSPVLQRIWLATVDRPTPDRVAVTGQVMARFGEPCAGGGDRGPAWSPDGSALAFQHGRGICVAAADSGVVRWFLRGQEKSGELRYPAWSPDGRLVAFSDCPLDGTSRRIWTVPAEGDQPSTLIQTPGGAEQPAFRTMPELRLTATATPPTIRLQGTTTVELRLSNQGSGTAPGAELSAAVSVGLRANQVQTGKGSCTGLRCTIGAITAGETVVVRIAATGTRVGRQTAEAVAGTALPEATAAENRVRVTVEVSRPDEPPPDIPPPDIPPPDIPPPDIPPPGTTPTGSLSVLTTSVTPVSYVGGADVVVSYTVRNGVSASVPSVRMRISLPRSLPRPKDVFPRACRVDGTSCEFGSFAPGERVFVRLTFPASKAALGVIAATVSSGGADATSADNTARARVEIRQPRLRVEPAIGPPGFVTSAIGRGLPPGATIRLTWSSGISERRGLVQVRPDGTIDAQALIFHNDLLGFRRLQANPVDGPQFGEVSSEPFHVVPRAVQPPFLTRN